MPDLEPLVGAFVERRSLAEDARDTLTGARNRLFKR